MSEKEKFIFEAMIHYPRVYEPWRFVAGSNDIKYSVNLNIEQVPVDLLKKCHRLTKLGVDDEVYLGVSASISPVIVPKGGLVNLTKMQIVLADADQCRVPYDRLLTHTTARFVVTVIEVDNSFYRGPKPLLTAIEVDYEQMTKRLELIVAEVMRDE